MKRLYIAVMLILCVCSAVAIASNIAKVEATITAQNTFTDPITVHEDSTKNRTDLGFLGVYVFGTSGDWVGTATLQAAFDYGTAWQDMKTYASTDAPFEPEYITQFEPGVLWRIGIKTGNYTSGSLPVRLSRIR